MSDTNNINENIKYVKELYRQLTKRLPYYYPKPKLVLYKSLKKLTKQVYYKDSIGFCDVENNSIHIYICDPDVHILSIILHEIGHIYAYNKFGPNDPRWAVEEVAEKYADKFADRWLRKLVKENWRVI